MTGCHSGDLDHNVWAHSARARPNITTKRRRTPPRMLTADHIPPPPDCDRPKAPWKSGSFSFPQHHAATSSRTQIGVYEACRLMPRAMHEASWASAEPSRPGLLCPRAAPTSSMPLTNWATVRSLVAACDPFARVADMTPELDSGSCRFRGSGASYPRNAREHRCRHRQQSRRLPLGERRCSPPSRASGRGTPSGG